MDRLVSALLIAVGLVNFLPVVGVLSADLLASAYGIAVPADDYGTELRKVVMIDVVALLVLFAAALLRRRLT